MYRNNKQQLDIYTEPQDFLLTLLFHGFHWQPLKTQGGKITAPHTHTHTLFLRISQELLGEVSVYRAGSHTHTNLFLLHWNKLLDCIVFRPK
jgi:hypothetical protein